MKYVSNSRSLILLMLLSSLLIGCPNGGNPFKKSSLPGGTISPAVQAQFNKNIEKANEELGRYSEHNDRSAFNDKLYTPELLSNLDNKKKSDEILADTEKGFGFKCEDDSESDSSDVIRFKQALNDLHNRSKLAGVLLNLNAYREIQQHEEALKEIPVDLARNAFLKAYKDKTKKVVLPKGSKKHLEKIKSKYEKLQALKKAVDALKSKDSRKVKVRKKLALDALKNYEKEDINKNIEKLVEMNLPKKHQESIAKQSMSEVKAYIESIESLENNENSTLARGAQEQRDLDIEERLLEEVRKQEANFNSLVGDLMKYSGNGEVAQSADEFFNPENGDLLEQSIEVTGWEFSPEMKYNLIKHSIDAEPKVDEQAVFAHLQEFSKDHENKYRDALNLFKDYKALEEFKKDNFYKKTFGDRISDLDKEFQVGEESSSEISAFRNYLKIMCKGDSKLVGKNCTLGEIINRTHKDPETQEKILEQTAFLLDIDRNVDEEGNLIPVTMEEVQAQLLSFDRARARLMNKFPKCLAKVDDEALKSVISSNAKDYVNCEVLKEAISPAGYGSLCGFDTGRSIASDRNTDEKGELPEGYKWGRNGELIPATETKN
ncbi:MAG: hypothetical protein ACPGJV_11475 [Bacteriovoracaceae bacterium]